MLATKVEIVGTVSMNFHGGNIAYDREVPCCGGFTFIPATLILLSIYHYVSRRTFSLPTCCPFLWARSTYCLHVALSPQPGPLPNLLLIGVVFLKISSLDSSQQCKWQRFYAEISFNIKILCWYFEKGWIPRPIYEIDKNLALQELHLSLIFPHG